MCLNQQTKVISMEESIDDPLEEKNEYLVNKDNCMIANAINDPCLVISPKKQFLKKNLNKTINKNDIKNNSDINNVKQENIKELHIIEEEHPKFVPSNKLANRISLINYMNVINSQKFKVSLNSFVFAMVIIRNL